VEIARRNLTRWTTDRKVVALTAYDPVRFEGDPTEAAQRTVLAWQRRGKYLLGRLSGGLTLLSHLGMTGKWIANPALDRPHVRVLLQVETRQVALIDARRFGRTWLLPDADADAHPRLVNLGPEPLDAAFDAAGLRRCVGAGRTPIKQRLLNQRVVAGLGNIAVVELAWRAGVHPHTPCRDVPDVAWSALHDAMLAHLNMVLEEEDSPEIAYMGERDAVNPFLCYGREASPCRRCDAPIERVVLSGRPTFFCPSCQPAPR